MPRGILGARTILGRPRMADTGWHRPRTGILKHSLRVPWGIPRLTLVDPGASGGLCIAHLCPWGVPWGPFAQYSCMWHRGLLCVRCVRGAPRRVRGAPRCVSASEGASGASGTRLTLVSPGASGGLCIAQMCPWGGPWGPFVQYSSMCASGGTSGCVRPQILGESLRIP